MPGPETEDWPELPSSTESRFAVAVHEAGHAIVFACLGFELQRVQLSEPGSKLIGSTLSGEFVAAERTDLLASLLAGDMAVDAICDSRVSAEMKSARDQQLLRKLDRELGITEGEKRIARRKAGEVVEAQRKHIITVANALIATPDGLLEGAPLDELLAPVRDECGRR